MTLTVYHKHTQLYTGMHYTTLLSRMKGLRFSRKLKQNTCIVLDSGTEEPNIIDMLFVFFSLDILWVNAAGVIVDIKRHIKPFTPFVIPCQPSRYVIEVNAGETKGLKIGDRLNITIH